MELLKLLSTSEIFAQVVSFLVLLFLLRLFAWKKLIKLLDDRRERIASDFKKIDDAKADVELLRSEYERRLAVIAQEAKAKIEEAIIEGRKAAEGIRQDAQTEGEKIIEKAKDNIKAEIAKAEEKLKNWIVSLTIDAAGRVIQEKLTEENDKKLVEEFLKEMEKGK